MAHTALSLLMEGCRRVARAVGASPPSSPLPPSSPAVRRRERSRSREALGLIFCFAEVLREALAPLAAASNV